MTTPFDSRTCSYCGLIDWTAKTYGRITHKCGCPYRTDEFCQTHPTCPVITDAITAANKMLHADRAEIVARTALAQDWEGLAHTARVVEILLDRFPDASDEEIAGAWLHDVVEDTGVHYADLADMHFSRLVLDIVGLVTRDGERYSDYKQKLLDAPGHAGRGARRVKFADATHNLERCRAALGVPKWERLGRERYEPMLSALAPLVL